MVRQSELGWRKSELRLKSFRSLCIWRRERRKHVVGLLGFWCTISWDRETQDRFDGFWCEMLIFICLWVKYNPPILWRDNWILGLVFWFGSLELQGKFWCALLSIDLLEFYLFTTTWLIVVVDIGLNCGIEWDHCRRYIEWLSFNTESWRTLLATQKNVYTWDKFCYKW